VGDSQRFPIYEALYMYNMLTNENEPLLADGPIAWEDQYNVIVKLKENIHFSDGEPLNADDVLFTFNVANEATGGFYTAWSNVWSYLEKVEKVDDFTVRFTIVKEPYNMHMLPSQLAAIKIVPEHIWQPIVDEAAGDVEKVRGVFNEEAIASGAFKLYFYDETRIVCIRDDNYWGQAENMFGKLSEVKYLVHPIYQDNAAGNLAFSQGELDVSQQFLPNVRELQESMDAPVTTFFSEAPYHQGAGMPSLIFNLSKEGLNDPAIRKAVALALDYEAISTNAMSGYSNDLVYCFFNSYLFGDYIDFDDEEVKDLMWDTTDLDANIAAANALLDEAGYADVDGDGLRELPDGSKIEWKAECPQGWSDWNASLEILSESAKKIGLNIVTYFPEASVYWDDLYPGNFDIAMNSPYPPLSVAMPWQAAYNVLYSKGVPPIGEATSRNFNRYNNPRVDELIDLAAGTDDIDLLREYYTEIDKIWLEELPTVLLMYRPQVFHTVYEGYWTGFGTADNGKNTPPMDATDGAGIKDLYNITPVKK
jgi:peptide/nickel transport system substrate-binding protein